MRLRKKGMAFLLAMVLASSPIQSGLRVYAEEAVEEQKSAEKETEKVKVQKEAQPETEAPVVETRKPETEKETQSVPAPETEPAVVETTKPEIETEAADQVETTPETETPESESKTETESKIETESETGTEVESEETEEIETETETISETNLEDEESTIKKTKSDKKPIDEVKELISQLKGEPLNVTMEDRAKIKKAGDAYSALSSADQAQLDRDQCLGTLADGIGTSQSYGRVLEACQWALRSLESPDTSTTLPEGTYTAQTNPAVSGTSDKGKSTSGRTRYWTIEQLIVDAGHNASARISVNSDGYDYIQCAGNRYQKLGDSAAGTSCFLVPVDPNSTFWILGHSTVMPTSIAYKLTCSIEEPAVSNQANVTFSAVNQKGEKIKNAVVSVNSGNTLPENGIYSLLKGANYTVEVTAVGYESKTISYTASEDEDYTFSLTAADRLLIKAEDADTGKTINAAYSVNIVNTERTQVEKYRNGEYFLTRGVKYRITAEASGYTNGTTIITSDGDRTVTIQMKKDGSASEESSKAVKKVINMIAALPSQPTEADRAAIVEAQKALIALDSEDEKKVTNRARLEAIYNKLGAKKASVGTYTFKSQSAGGGRGAYQAESIETSTHGEAMFRVVNVVLRVDKNGNMTADITLSGTGYRYVYMGTATAAFEAEEAAGGFRKCAQAKGIIKGEPVSYQDTDGKHSAYRFTIPVETLDHPIMIAGQSWSHDSLNADKSKKERRTLQGDGTNSYTSLWFERAIILSSKQMVKVSSDSDAKEDGDVEDRKEGDDINETPDKTVTKKAGSGSQTVGKYAFSWSGGTMGHVTIQCQNVEIRDGQAYVTISFVRKASIGGTAQFSQVTSLGQTVSGNNVFTIPVNLNANTSIEAYTTAMSQGHWVHYTIYVGVNDQSILEQVGQGSNVAGAIESTVGNNTSILDKEAPKIIGLKGGQEVTLQASKLLKIFKYDDGYYLIEVDLGTKPVPEQVEKQTEKQTEKEREEESTSVEEVLDEEAVADTEEGTTDNSKYRDESIGRAYQNRIVKYLVIPEGKEVPVGLEEMVVLVQEPVSKLYVSSVPALKLLDENGDTAKVASVGMKDTDDLPESIAKRMEDDASDEEKVEFFGSYDNWKLKKMIKNKTDMIIEDERIIPQNNSNREDEMELYKKLTSRASQMGTAVFIDRSDSETDVKAKEDWKAAYQILLGRKTK